MRKTVFLQVLDAAPEAKGWDLARIVATLRESDDTAGIDSAFFVEASEFSAVPGSPFAYWTGTAIREIFRRFPPLEGNIGTVKQGLATADDFRFVRARWEVDPRRMGYSPEQTLRGRGWIHLAKGGSYSPYYADVHLVVNWFRRGRELKGFRRPDGRPAAVIRNERYYFRPGLTWPLRARAFCPQALPRGCIFSARGYALIAPLRRLPALLGFLSSVVFDYLFKVCLGRVGHPEFVVGTLQRLPVPRLDGKMQAVLEEWTMQALAIRRRLSQLDEVTCESGLPALVGVHRVDARTQSLSLEGLGTQDRRQLDELGKRVDSHALGAYGLKIADVPMDESKHGSGAAATVNSDTGKNAPLAGSPSHHVADLLMWCVGVAFGRWDVRMARDDWLIPKLQGPFDRLPEVAPGGLVGPDALPATRNRIASEAWLRTRADVITPPEPGSFDGPDHITAAGYPVQVAWDGVLVDDPGHPSDIVGRIREVLGFVYGPDRAGAIEDQALEILRAGGNKPRSLRDWFRSQKAGELRLSFFDFHIRRYSKSRRKAPIYWRLCTSRRKQSYGVWLYYHRLTDDTLWTVLNDYVGPRWEREERRTEELRRRIASSSGREVRRLEREREKANSLLGEIESLENPLRKVAEGGWVPDMDDGVLINLAPLHAVVPWKEPEKMWKKLEKGDYDWAHLALRCWPERVREKCRTDRSLAIAHGLQQENHQDG